MNGGLIPDNIRRRDELKESVRQIDKTSQPSDGQCVFLYVTKLSERDTLFIVQTSGNHYDKADFEETFRANYLDCHVWGQVPRREATICHGGPGDRVLRACAGEVERGGARRWGRRRSEPRVRHRCLGRRRSQRCLGRKAPRDMQKRGSSKAEGIITWEQRQAERKTRTRCADRGCAGQWAWDIERKTPGKRAAKRKQKASSPAAVTPAPPGARTPFGEARRLGHPCRMVTRGVRSKSTALPTSFVDDGHLDDECGDFAGAGEDFFRLWSEQSNFHEARFNLQGTAEVGGGCRSQDVSAPGCRRSAAMLAFSTPAAAAPVRLS